jgi:hypothetical protein
MGVNIAKNVGCPLAGRIGAVWKDKEALDPFKRR